jgi:hypothetical protein
MGGSSGEYGKIMERSVCVPCSIHIHIFYGRGRKLGIACTQSICCWEMNLLQSLFESQDPFP